jgi:mannose-6-phosphate isomerase-like protein (cupin superfamily)
MAVHIDDYAQVFCVLEGRGEGEVDGEPVRTPSGPPPINRSSS